MFRARLRQGSVALVSSPRLRLADSGRPAAPVQGQDVRRQAECLGCLGHLLRLARTLLPQFVVHDQGKRCWLLAIALRGVALGG